MRYLFNDTPIVVSEIAFFSRVFVIGRNISCLIYLLFYFPELVVLISNVHMVSKAWKGEGEGLVEGMIPISSGLFSFSGM